MYKAYFYGKSHSNSHCFQEHTGPVRGTMEGRLLWGVGNSSCNSVSHLQGEVGEAWARYFPSLGLSFSSSQKMELVTPTVFFTPKTL